MDFDYLPVSDGNGDAALMHVTATRIQGSPNIAVDGVVNVPAKFIGTYGKIAASGLLDPDTVRNFKGHLSGTNVVIDGFEPGSTDNGTPQGYVVVIKPNTGWNQRVANFIKNATGVGTPAPITASTLTATNLVATGTTSFPPGGIARSAIVKAPYCKLYYQIGGLLGGQVIAVNTESPAFFTASDVAGSAGVTPTLASSNPAFVTVTGAGVYSFETFINMSDGFTGAFIIWFDVDIDGTGFNYRQRHYDRTVQGGIGQAWNTTMSLPANAKVRLTMWSGGQQVRVASPGAGAISDPFINQNFGPYLIVRQIA